jgi:hypothetical protein
MANAVGPRAPAGALRRARHVLIGLALGAIPVIVALVAAYGGTVGGSIGGISLTGATSVGLLIAGGVLYLAALIGALICQRSAPLRFVGYGLMAAVIAAPFLFVIGFIVFFRMAGPLPFVFEGPFGRRALSSG